MLCFGAVISLVVLATRQDIVFPGVYCWTVIAIVVRDPDNRAVGGESHRTAITSPPSAASVGTLKPRAKCGHDGPR